MRRLEMKPRPEFGAPPQAKGPSDAELLLRIAKRDREAFDLLYARHERLLFNLAQYLTQDSDLGQEAFQEAQLRIWRFAHNFKPGGNAKGWLIRIQVRECLKHRRKTLDQKRLESSTSGPALRSPRESLEQPAEQAEVLAGLRLAIQTLPAQARTLLFLAYGTGFNQKEIGRLLQLPQSTVSHQLGEALRVLHRRMRAPGPLAGVAAFSESLLRQAVARWFEPPAELRATLLRRLAAEESLTRSRPSLLLALPGWRSLAAATCLAGLLLGWVVPSRRDPHPPLTNPGGLALPGNPDPAAGPADAGRVPEPMRSGRLRRSWSFDTGIPEELQPFMGSWSHWEPARRGLPAAAVSRLYSNHQVYVRLPVSVPAAPLRITAHVRANLALGEVNRPVGSSLTVAWVTERNLQLMNQCRSFRTLHPLELEKPIQYDFYLYQRFILRKIREAGHLAGIAEYERPYPTQGLAFVVHGLAVESLSIEEVEESEIPALLKDPRAFQRILASDPQNWGIPPPVRPLVEGERPER